MNDKKTNIVIAIATLIGSVIMVIALSYAIGKWSFNSGRHKVLVAFPNASGLNANSEVKYAGAPIGRVESITLIPRDKQTQDPMTKAYNSVLVTAEIEPNVEIGKDVNATIKQDGLGIAAKYLLFSPGPDHLSPLLTDGYIIQGTMPYELTDLVQPAGEALAKAGRLLDSIEPDLAQLHQICDLINNRLPPLLDKTEKLVVDGDGILSPLNTDSEREKISHLIVNLNVVTDNLKVVTTNFKAITATLAKEPWRMVWGGKTITPPTEEEILKSNHVLPLQPDVEINTTTPKVDKRTTTSTEPATPQN